MEIKTTHEIAKLHEDTPCLDIDCKKRWVSVNDIIKYTKEYECPHQHLGQHPCNCCDGVSELKDELSNSRPKKGADN